MCCTLLKNCPIFFPSCSSNLNCFSENISWGFSLSFDAVISTLMMIVRVQKPIVLGKLDVKPGKQNFVKFWREWKVFDGG